jgi:hypothetical protein
MSHEQHTSMIKTLQDCITECNHCAMACLDEQDPQLAACIRHNLDCAAICATTAELAARNSTHLHHLMELCAEVCEACAAECEHHGSKYDHCKRCAEVCRQCAEECRAMA